MGEGEGVWEGFLRQRAGPKPGEASIPLSCDPRAALPALAAVAGAPRTGPARSITASLLPALRVGREKSQRLVALYLCLGLFHSSLSFSILSLSAPWFRRLLFRARKLPLPAGRVAPSVWCGPGQRGQAARNISFIRLGRWFLQARCKSKRAARFARAAVLPPPTSFLSYSSMRTSRTYFKIYYY